jgi:hypothetical protein
MFEIAPHHRFPIFQLLAFAIPAAAVGVLLLYLANRSQFRRVVARAAVAGVRAREPARHSGVRGAPAWAR